MCNHILALHTIDSDRQLSHCYEDLQMKTGHLAPRSVYKWQLTHLQSIYDLD